MPSAGPGAVAIAACVAGPATISLAPVQTMSTHASGRIRRGVGAPSVVQRQAT